MKLRNDVGCGDDRVDTLVWMRPVTSLSFDADMQGIRSGHKAAHAQSHRAGGEIGPAVGAQNQIRGIALQQSGIDHRFGALTSFLGRLKEQDHSAAPGLLQGGEDACAQEKGRGMDIMSAAVAHSGML